MDKNIVSDQVRRAAIIRFGSICRQAVGIPNRSNLGANKEFSIRQTSFN